MTDPGARTTGSISSGPSLTAKLGIAAGMSITLVRSPKGFADSLERLPEGVRVRSSLRAGQHVDLVVAFVTDRGHLETHLLRYLAALEPDGVLWVAWPKKSSKVPTDMSDEAIREIVLPTGWVDTKVCAIDATWSGLKLVLRRELRPTKA